MLAKRVPVLRGKVPLMPMKLSKAYRFVNSGRAKWRWDEKLKIRYIKLLFEPSGYDTQAIHLGIDHGSVFDGFTISSNHCHHENVELIHNKTIKRKMEKRAKYRRIRRSRLRNRPIRNETRIASKMVPTIRAMFEYRKWLVEKLLGLYPVSKVIYEQVKYGGYSQRPYAHVHLGQEKTIDYLKSKILNVEVFRSEGTETLRSKIFKKYGFDPKVQDVQRKAERSFHTHCVDSFVLSRIGFDFISIFKLLNNKVLYLTKILYSRRELKRLRVRRGNGKKYFRYRKEGIKEYITKFSKLTRIRIKPEGEHSNHLKKWNYEYLDQTECKKSKWYYYGGTMIEEGSYHPNFIGTSKYMKFKNNTLVSFNRRFEEITVGK